MRGCHLVLREPRAQGEPSPGSRGRAYHMRGAAGPQASFSDGLLLSCSGFRPGHGPLAFSALLAPLSVAVIVGPRLRPGWGAKRGPLAGLLDLGARPQLRSPSWML